MCPLGCIHLNRLRDIKRIPIEVQEDSDSEDGEETDDKGLILKDSDSVVGFDMD